MASASYMFATFLVLGLLFCSVHGSLRQSFYDKSCPNLQNIVRGVVADAINKEKRMGASLLRLHFHDCFVQGCDASILLDDTNGFVGEKNAVPNANSVRGYEVIDAIKTKVEAACPKKVSCADIVTLAARDSVNLLGGPTWKVTLGRRDSRTASQNLANSDLPSPFSSLDTLKQMFAAKGLSVGVMTALSGAHTIGLARCGLFRDRIYNEKNIDSSFSRLRQQTCPRFGGDSTLAPMDVQSPEAFDNKFYVNLVGKKGLFHSDQVLYNRGSQDYLVSRYSKNVTAFFEGFVYAMGKMGAITPLTGTQGEIRTNCRKIN